MSQAPQTSWWWGVGGPEVLDTSKNSSHDFSHLWIFMNLEQFQPTHLLEASAAPMWTFWLIPVIYFCLQALNPIPITSCEPLAEWVQGGVPHTLLAIMIGGITLRRFLFCGKRKFELRTRFNNRRYPTLIFFRNQELLSCSHYNSPEPVPEPFLFF